MNKTIHRALPLALAGGCALAAGMGIGRFAYTPLLPFMQRDAGLTIAAAGYVASANFLGYLVGALLAMRLGPGHRNTGFMLGLIASLITTFAMAGFDSPWMLGAIRGLSGIASAFVLIQGSAIALDAMARLGTPSLLSVLYAGVGVGIAASAALVEALSRANASASTMWIAMGMIATLLGVPALMLRDHTEAAPPADPASANARDAANPARADRSGSRRRQALGWLTAAYGSLGFGYVITVTFIVVIVRSRSAWQPWEMVIWMCVGLAGAPSNYLWMLIAQRIGNHRAMTAAFLLEALGVLLAVVGTSLWQVALGAMLLGGTFMAITAMGLGTGRQLAGGDSASIVGRMTAAFGLGQILGPALGGWIAERTHSFTSPSLLAALVLVAAAAMVERSRRCA